MKLLSIFFDISSLLYQKALLEQSVRINRTDVEHKYWPEIIGFFEKQYIV